MHNKTDLRLIPALLAITFAGGAHASGFQLMGEQSASGIGNSGAGSAAVAENAGTIFYNPAGMTQLQAREVSLGLTLVNTSFELSDGGSSNLGGLNNTGNGGDAGKLRAVPNFYGSWAVTKDIYVGLGIGAPFGLMTEYKDPWIGAAHSQSFEIKTININPSIAWRATDWLSLGAGINWQKIDAEYVRRVATSGVPNTACSISVPQNAVCNSHAKMTLDDSAWGWNLGALFTLAPQTKLGVSYRSKIKYSTDGNVSVSGPNAALNAGGSSGVKADIEVPDTFILSLVQGIGAQWELLGDISWTGWSSIPKVDIIRTSGAASGTIAQTLDTHFEDAWRFALGANYKLNDTWKLRFGVAYDETPVPNAQYRLTSLPDNDRTWLSTGFQWKMAKSMAVDVGFAYLFVKDAPIDNNQSTAVATTNKGTIKGTYDNSAWLLGTQFSMSF
ncbi:MAG: transporter [Betaproteobacteria bacterium]|nr:transporter [Betaproteobacteria bacterium]